MSHILRGRLCGYICEECSEPLVAVTVKLYRLRDDQDATVLAVASPKETFGVVEEDARKEKDKFLLAQGTTDDQGRFAIELPEKHGGGPIEIDVAMEEPPHEEGFDRGALQFTITTLQPRWRQVGDDLVAFWDYCLPWRYWCWVLGWWGLRVICGRVTVCKTQAPVGGVKVSAFDADWIEDDPLGDDITDASGSFRIYYSTADYERTPLSPWINWEWVHGPDVYFRIVEPVTNAPLLVEPRSRARQPDRENVAHCFCVELCLEEPPQPPEPPPVFSHIGGYNFLTAIDSAPTGSGLTLVDNRAFYDTIRLNGVLAKKLNGNPLQYMFEVTEIDMSGVPIGPAVQITPAQIARTKIGLLSIYAPTGSSDPNPIKNWDYTVNGTAGPTERVATFSADGWIEVPQESNVFGTGFFTPLGDMIRLITETLASWTPIDMTGKEAGQSSGLPFAQNKHFRIQMWVREGSAGVPVSGGVCEHVAIENTLYDNISHHPSWAGWTESGALGVAIIDIAQLMGPGNGCKKITNALDVQVTAAHPNLGTVSVWMSGPGGPYSFTLPAPTPDELFGTATPSFAVASLPQCAYVVHLSVQLLLTTGDTAPLPLTDLIAFCK